jgi:hypothetical protein
VSVWPREDPNADVDARVQAGADRVVDDQHAVTAVKLWAPSCVDSAKPSVSWFSVASYAALSFSRVAAQTDPSPAFAIIAVTPINGSTAAEAIVERAKNPIAAVTAFFYTRRWACAPRGRERRSGETLAARFRTVAQDRLA